MEQVLNIQSFGARLRARDGLFKVTIPDLTGAQNDQEFDYASHTVQTIMLHPKVSVSSDALLLAEKSGTMVIVVDEQDSPVIFMAGLHPAGPVEIWRQQMLLQNTPTGFNHARDWLCLKEQRKIKLLARFRRYREGEAVEWIDQCSVQIQESLARMRATTCPLDKINETSAKLRGIEGHSQRVYLDTLSNLLPARTRFDGRSRPAADLFNAMLNYAYGVLYHRIEKILWQTGLNPYYGFLHGESRKQKSFLYDFIEPYRPWMDKIVFNLCAGKEVSPQKHLCDAPAKSNGGLWLTREGKGLLLTAIHNRFDMEKELRHGQQRNRWQAIELDARALIRTIVLPVSIATETLLAIN
jgi:CRISP-associated protein Cas1